MPLVLWKMVFAWRRGTNAGRTRLLHVSCSVVTRQPNWIFRLARPHTCSLFSGDVWVRNGARRRQRYYGKGKESRRRHRSFMNFQRGLRDRYTQISFDKVFPHSLMKIFMPCHIKPMIIHLSPSLLWAGCCICTEICFARMPALLSAFKF